MGEGKRRSEQRLTSTSGTVGIKCPFFHMHSANQIRCEGIMDGCTIAFIFREKSDKEFQLRTYCEQHYDKCEHYRMMMQEIYQVDE